MIEVLKRTAAPVLFAVGVLAGPALAAAASPIGVWTDHTGRAAIEITDCGGKLCGRIVWLKDAANSSACGMQIIGDVKPVAGGKWDKGWILDPEKDSKYDVELTPVGEQKLKVLGYAGMKMLSETYMWTRAAPDLKRCDARADRTPAAPSDVPFNPGPSAAPSPNAPGPGAPGPSTPGPSATPAPGPGPGTGPGPSTRQPEPSRPYAGPGAAPEQPAPVEEKPPGKRRAANPKECTLELPYIKLTVPCDDEKE